MRRENHQTDGDENKEGEANAIDQIHCRGPIVLFVADRLNALAKVTKRLRIGFALSNYICVPCFDNQGPIEAPSMSASG